MTMGRTTQWCERGNRNCRHSKPVLSAFGPKLMLFAWQLFTIWLLVICMIRLKMSVNKQLLVQNGLSACEPMLCSLRATHVLLDVTTWADESLQTIDFLLEYGAHEDGGFPVFNVLERSPGRKPRKDRRGRKGERKERRMLEAKTI